MAKRSITRKRSSTAKTSRSTLSPHAMIRRHLGRDPLGLTVVSQKFQTYERANVQRGLQSVLAPDGQLDAVGVIAHQDHDRPSLVRLAHGTSASRYFAGPPEYMEHDVGPEKQLACLASGMLLVEFRGQPLVLLVTEAEYPPAIVVQGVAASKDIAEDALREIGLSGWRQSPMRGQVISMAGDCFRGFTLKFHELPSIAPDELILPDDVRARLERHTVVFTRHAERLKIAGRHIKRGILLHGPPGTGKSLSAMYLGSQMPERTVVLLTGAGMGSIEEAGRLARLLQPATIILEDVDLVGTERQGQTLGANAVLFELLNQMDGLASDYDVLFVLTTNRPDVLEPALASRPGRIDQAIEIPLPDDACRGRLIELYSRGMSVKLADRSKWIAATAGASAAFMKELMRRSAVFAIERAPDQNLVVSDADVEAALRELLLAGAMTRTLLGGAVAG